MTIDKTHVGSHRRLSPTSSAVASILCSMPCLPFSGRKADGFYPAHAPNQGRLFTPSKGHNTPVNSAGDTSLLVLVREGRLTPVWLCATEQVPTVRERSRAHGKPNIL